MRVEKHDGGSVGARLKVRDRRLQPRVPQRAHAVPLDHQPRVRHKLLHHHRQREHRPVLPLAQLLQTLLAHHDGKAVAAGAARSHRLAHERVR